jgi:hypothetical protein
LFIGDGLRRHGGSVQASLMLRAAAAMGFPEMR